MKTRQTPQGSSSKRRRVTQACDFCHRRSIRCRPSSISRTCQNCKDFGHQCTYHREPRQRGIRPRTTDDAPRASTAFGQDDTSTPISASSRRNQQASFSVATHQRPEDDTQGVTNVWSAPVVASQAVIVDLTDLYFEIVYPIFPLFHQPSFTRRISRAEYMHEPALFAATMAACALVSRRIRDGAVANSQWDLSTLRTTTNPDNFIAQAKTALSRQETKSDLNTLRAHAMLALASIQQGNTKDMHFHLGMYHTLVAMDKLHDESLWPSNIGVIEREERRRLFWSMYTLDIYTSVVWGGIIRSQERQSKVAYPMEIDDTNLTDSTVDQQTTGQQTFSSVAVGRSTGLTAPCWLSGWNFITDLYRVLEHALTRFRGHGKAHDKTDSVLQDILLSDKSSISETSIADSILQLYLNLPACFKDTPDMTFDKTKDRYAFQAANITATLQLVRMVLLAAGGATIAARCQIAREVVDAFSSIPAAYLLAISTPLLHHLGGIGTVLGSVLEEPGTTKSEYEMVQSILLSMAQLFEKLEPIHQTSSASQSIRDTAARIESVLEPRQVSIPISIEREVTNAVNQPAESLWQANDDIDNANREGLPDTATDILPSLMDSDLLGQFAWNFDFGQTWS